MRLDHHGQPLNKLFNRQMRTDRDIDELLGLCRGIVCDGIVMQEEAIFLASWLERHRDIMEVWPASFILARLREMLADGVLDSDEERELLDMLCKTSGGNPAIFDVASLSTDLPFTQPCPKLLFDGHSYCLTGTFAVGTRAECSAVIAQYGATVSTSITKDTHFVVVGTLGSRDWRHSTHGRKIERAIDYRNKYGRPAIVPERAWAAAFGLIHDGEPGTLP